MSIRKILQKVNQNKRMKIENKSILNRFSNILNQILDETCSISFMLELDLKFLKEKCTPKHTHTIIKKAHIARLQLGKRANRLCLWFN